MNPALTANDKTTIKRLRQDGFTIRQVAKKLNISHGVVQKYSVGMGKSINGKVITKQNKQQITSKVNSLLREGKKQIEITKQLGVSKSFIQSVQNKVVVDESIFQGYFPKAEAQEFSPFLITKPGRYLILSDIHIPGHCERTLMAAVKEAKRRGVCGVILNGDFVDYHELSSHEQDPSAARYQRETELAVNFLSWMRSQFTKQDYFYLEGNHEMRLKRYIISRASALYGKDGKSISVETELKLNQFGVEYIKDKRSARLGDLGLYHGHEFAGGGGANPAKWLYGKTHSDSACGHLHRTDSHQHRNAIGEVVSVWTIGCCCILNPRWLPFNAWNNGVAFVELYKDHSYTFDNLRIRDGKIV